ncbi:MAG: sensor histidine kinase [Dehalococcoidia bacterium]
MFHNARLRLTAWYAAAITVVLLVLGFATYFILRSEIDREIDDSLETTLAEIAPRIAPTGGGRPEPGSDDDDGRFRGFRPGPAPIISTDVFTLVLGRDGRVLFNSRNLDIEEWPLASIAATSTTTPQNDEFSEDGTRYRLRSMLTGGGRDPEQVVAVGRSLSARDRQLDVILWVLGAGGAAGVLLASAGGYFLAGITLDPIRRALETQQRFVSDASHELRTPIAVVTANADVLLGHSEQSIEDNIDHVAAISDEAGQMAKLVSDLLMLARADEGRLNLELATVDAAAIVAGAAEALSVIATERRVTLVPNVAPAPLEADPVRLRQVVVILLDNALKYTSAGGRVTVSCARRGSFVELAVADTGPGIAPASQARIFDRFYRTDESRTAGGAGLGLAIAKTIVDAHGGRISVESALGKGSTFTVRLPAKR